ncbi:Adenosine 3'-phospho 5'-phosphosulfate transporter 2 isoform 1 [Schistosoma japonicum]|uniref:Adenosine 3'-phospho 5'-phosphosulfate transporter 2 n=2 Tax=Schistosoma japonicum TaxID=6182 RepID=A0A4Z2DB74_SCHJA|nr:Adenosine 3'-phospho 5'-phosphosulfate transporter 2 isoform 1 [Schistosoma japonicum]
MQRHSSKMTKAEVAEQVAVELISSPMNNDIYICGFNMSSLAPKWKFSISVAGIFILYICFGALQEAIFSANDLRSYSPFLTLYQFGIYSILSLFELRAQGYLLFNSWTHLYAVVAVLTLGSIAFSNASVGFLNYPTQVIFKCCKMIPVLLGGVIIQGKRYSIYEVTAVLLMTLGLICFTLVDVSIQPKFTLFGVFLVSLALCCDGALGNCQEVIMKKYVRSNTEILFYSYSVGFCLLATVLTISGNLLPSFYFFNDHALQTYGYGFIFSLSGYFGVQFVLCLVHSHGALTAVTVTTFRKAVSITLSFIMFEKPFSQGYIWSGLLVVFGLYLNLYNKNRSTWNTTILNKLKSFHLIKSDTKSILSV